MTLLGDVAEFEMGQAPPGTECNMDGIGTLFVKAGEFGKPYPIEREWTTKPLKLGRRGDVFICVVGATAGKLNLGIDCAIGRSVAAIRPSANIDTKFLYYQLQPWVLKLRAASAGSAQGVISKKQLSEIPVELPEVDEQRRIVAEIEKQFSRLDEAVANLQRVKASLKRYRAAVRKAAVEGRLVPIEAELARTERRSYESGLALLQRILQTCSNAASRKRKDPAEFEAYGRPDLPEGWAWCSIAQIGIVASGNTPAGILEAARPTGTTPWFKVGDMNHEENKSVLRRADTWLSQHDVKQLSMRVFPSQTVLFPKRGGAIATNKKRRLESPGCADLNVMGITPSSEVADYFFMWFDSVDLASLSDGSNVPQINHKDIDPLAVPLPPIAEQHRIVAEVDRRLSIVREVEAGVDANLKRAQALRQAVLAKAFGRVNDHE